MRLPESYDQRFKTVLNAWYAGLLRSAAATFIGQQPMEIFGGSPLERLYSEHYGAMQKVALNVLSKPATARTMQYRVAVPSGVDVSVTLQFSASPDPSARSSAAELVRMAF